MVPNNVKDGTPAKRALTLRVGGGLSTFNFGLLTPIDGTPAYRAHRLLSLSRFTVAAADGGHCHWSLSLSPQPVTATITGSGSGSRINITRNSEPGTRNCGWVGGGPKKGRRVAAPKKMRKIDRIRQLLAAVVPAFAVVVFVAAVAGFFAVVVFLAAAAGFFAVVVFLVGVDFGLAA